MSENTSIEWCDYTFNPWIGCTKKSPGCANCYAERQDKHRKWTPEGWGEGKPRKRTSAANWKQVERWDRWAFPAGIAEMRGREFIGCHRPRVFVGSLMDWLDPEVPIEWLADLLDLIRRCPNLDFLMLTKRPELWKERTFVHLYNDVEGHGGNHRLADFLLFWLEGVPPSNVWIGASLEQPNDKRILDLLNIPARVRFLSCEPLLEEVNLQSIELPGEFDLDCLAGTNGDNPCGPLIHWVICGGESGPNARPMHPDWARSLRDQCQEAGVAFLFKQWGEWVPECHPAWTKKAELSDQFVEITEEGDDYHGLYMARIGKKAAGRLLDGRGWNEFPEVK